MDKDTAIQTVRSSWKRFYPADKKGRGIVCPICGNGRGSSGDGITENPHKAGQLKCWKCGFQGDVIDLKMQETGEEFMPALSLLAADIGIDIDQNATPDNGTKQPKEQDYKAETIEEWETRAARETDAFCKAFALWYSGKNFTEKQTKWLYEHAGIYDDPKQLFIDSGFLEKDGKTPTEYGKTALATAEQAATAATIADYTAYYKQCAERLSDPAAVSYLLARGISPATAAAYNLGYDPAWISPTVIKNQKAKGSDWQPAPTARIIMPVSKNHYVARAISPDVTKFAKMNETGGGSAGIFNSRAVYGDQEAVFVVEGIFDALSIIEAGAAAVALNSTSNADLFVKQLEKEPARATIILCLDNDDSGKRAAETLRQGLTRLNISYIAADINGRFKDPNDALTGDRAAFIKAVQDAQAQTAAKPDNTSAYIDNLMQGDIARLKAAADRKTGFSDLDEKSGGLYPGLYVIAATSSLGKTTFSLQIADNLAAAGHDVLFFSMEQSRLELISKSFTRILAQEKNVRINSLALRKGYYPDKMKEAAEIYKEKIADRMSIIEGNFACDISFIGDYIRRYIRRNGGSPIVFVDYLQILQPAPDARTMSVKETVDSTVTELKRISREHDLTVFVVSSVNRANYLSPIDFEALKESGGIEYTADVIYGLQLQCVNSELFDKKENIKEKRQAIREAKARNPRQIELLCLKNRYGIANFSSAFDYYPEHDLFEQATSFHSSYGQSGFETEPPAVRENGKTIPIKI